MSVTIGGAKPPRSLRSREDAGASLQDFYSPSVALAHAPVALAARGTIWLVATLAIACLAAAGLIPIDKVVSAQGRVIAQTATTVVQPLETAIVRSIDVHEGDTVKRGQLLARLDPTFATADVGALQAQVTSLQAEVDRLRAEAAGTEYRPTGLDPSSVLQGAIFLQRQSERAAKNENYAQKLSSLHAQETRARADIAAYTDRLRVATIIEEKRAELEKLQVGSMLNRLSALDSRLEVKRGLDNATAQADQASGDLRALIAERDAYNQNWNSQTSHDLVEQSRKLNDAEENLKKAQLRRQLVELRAPEDATVLSVAKVSPGSVMQSGEQLITLVPDGAPLEVEVNVPGSEVGYVRPGDDVTLKLETLPYTHYGTIDARVRVVSPDSFSAQDEQQQPKRGSQPTQSPTPGNSYYRARLAIDASHLHDVPSGFHLMPGMPVTADVKTGKRTVLTYLLSRVLPTLMDGMREN